VQLLTKFLQAYFSKIEPRLTKQAGQLESPPVFIVGPPRSGTTLVYQVITTCLETSYFCNMADKHHTTPIAATHFARRKVASYQSNYRSDYGEVDGRGGPAEAQLIWKRWFGRDRTNGSNVSAATRSEAVATVAAIQDILSGPFFAKDISNSLRVRALELTFPGCLFIRISRDPFAIAKSILKARHEFRASKGFALTNDPKNEWVFINSKDFEQFHELPYLEQIANQIFHTEQILNEDLATLAPDRCIQIKYQDFCSNPRLEIERLQNFTNSHAVELRQKSEVPESFTRPKRSETLTDEQKAEREALNTCLENVYAAEVT
jgi:hypothetical protein